MSIISFIPLEEKHYDNLKDESRLVGFGEWIFYPSSSKELEEAIIEAKNKNYHLTIRGSGTGIVGGAVPNGGAVLNLSKLNKIKGFKKDKKDYLITLGAGTTINDLDEFLKKGHLPDSFSETEKADYFEMKKQGDFCFLPNPSEKSATFGGVYATSASGSNILGYKKTSKYINSITGYFSDGSKLKISSEDFVEYKEDEIRILGRTIDTKGLDIDVLRKIKNNKIRAIDFLSGSEGSLFIISDLEIIIKKSPKYSYGIHYFFKNDKTFFGFIDFLYQWKQGDDKNILIGCEYYDEQSLKLISKNKDNMAVLKNISNFPADAISSVFIELSWSSQEELEEVVFEHFEGFLDAGGDEKDTWAVDSPLDIQKFHDLRHCLPELINNIVDRIKINNKDFVKIGLDFTGPKEDIITYLKMYHKGIEDTKIQGFVFGHILQNHFHVNLLPTEITEEKKAEDLVEEFGKKVVNDGGKLVSENGVGKVKKTLIQDYLQKDILIFYERVKKSFDKEGRLA